MMNTSILKDINKWEDSQPLYKVKFKGKKKASFASYRRWLKSTAYLEIWGECDASYPFKRNG